MKTGRRFILYFLCTSFLSAGINWRTLHSSKDKLSIEVNFEFAKGEKLEPLTLLFGIPTHELPKLNVRSFNKRKIGFIDDSDNGGVKWINQQKVRQLETASLEIHPQADVNYYYQNFVIDVTFRTEPSKTIKVQKIQRSFLQQRIVNWDVAQNWFQPRKRMQRKSSELPEGTWIKLKTADDQMIAISGADLLSLSSALQQSDPRSFMLFTGSSLGRDRSKTVINTITYSENPENLVETAFVFSGENNGTLDTGDKILFYGRGASGFDLDIDDVKHHQNIYFTENIYWLLIPDDSSLRGKRVTAADIPSSTSLTLDYATSFVHIENDITNPFGSGLAWTGTSFGRGASFTVIPELHNIKTTVDAYFEIAVRGSTTDFEYVPNPRHIIDMYLNSRDELRENYNFSGLSKQTKSFTASGADLTEGVNLVYMDNNSTSSYSLPHFDHATVSYGRTLNVENSPFEFFAPIHSNSVSFTLTGTSTPTVWDISNIIQPQSITVESTGNDYAIAVDLPTDTSARFIAFIDDDVQTLSELTLMSNHSFTALRNQNPGVDHLVIGPEEFRSAAQPLIDHRGSSRFIALAEIYNEFSGGNADPTAIRRFLQWTQEEWSDPKPYFVLLLGDTDYDYRNITGESLSKVPTIITGAFNNRAIDDRLAAINGRIPDLAIGRFPSKTVNEVDDFVEKIIEYETNPILGLWRQRVTLVADDAARPEPDHGGGIEDAKNHTTASNEIADQITLRVEINKLYMVEYPEVSDASSYGVIKPDATAALMETLSEGTAIINYIGHGSAHQWAQEKLLVQDRGDINQMNTEMKLPIWVAGTCSWGHFDFLDVESFAEELIRQPMEGAAAIITTSRAIGIGSNEFYIKEIFRAFFPSQDITTEPIGVVLQSVKDGGTGGELFHLFGDPAMHHPIPTATVELTSVNPDTLIALDTARVYGQQTIAVASISGIIHLNDSERDVTRQYVIASQTEEISYTLPGPTLFKGKFTAAQQQFSARMRIPLDISYSITPAFCNVYVQLETDPPVEALGILENIYLQGGDPVQDSQGPIISFETEAGRLLRNNDHLQSDEKVFLRLSDPLGINVTGEVGHEIMITDLSDDSKNDLSSRFTYDENSITTGILSIPYNNDNESLDLAVKAWDNANNPAEKNITLHILSKQKLQVMNIMNFPNPYATTTQFAFELTSSATISIDVYTLGGRRVVSIQEESFSSGYNYINWDGRDAYGERLANGVYLYRLTVDSGDERITVIRKLAKFQ
uniref:Gingipain domain-containing protein n=1 Tax=uncultured marine group II/III euryarchaeote KM3_94_C01 TaxID=1456545 RepID=A0A075I4H8_9EURY|nr:hypothetical protein [uncultured marine group II/III euryarchaeote KM3_94_C01]